MRQFETRTEVLNPCPSCGSTFDCNGCMTFVDHFLQQSTNGKCPTCGTQVLVETKYYFHGEAWANELDPKLYSEFRIAELGLSVRATNSLDQMRVITVGDLLKITEAQIRSQFKIADPIVLEVTRFLSSKQLSLRKS